MSSFPRSPRLQKGAIIGLDPFNPLASIIVFQYNPESMSRSLAVNAFGKEANMGEALRLNGPPRETITVSIEIDATDQLEKGDPLAASLGIYPTLSSLEMLLYPKSALVIGNQIAAAFGITEIIPPEAPLTLFIWGIKRMLPVRITALTITEEAFDPDLNPIQAKVSLTMNVLTYHDLGLLTPGGTLFMAHQVVKEVMATIGGVGNIAGVVSGSVNIL